MDKEGLLLDSDDHVFFTDDTKTHWTISVVDGKSKRYVSFSSSDNLPTSADIGDSEKLHLSY